MNFKRKSSLATPEVHLTKVKGSETNSFCRWTFWPLQHDGGISELSHLEMLFLKRSDRLCNVQLISRTVFQLLKIFSSSCVISDSVHYFYDACTVSFWGWLHMCGAQRPGHGADQLLLWLQKCLFNVVFITYVLMFGVHSAPSGCYSPVSL